VSVAATSSLSVVSAQQQRASWTHRTATCQPSDVEDLCVSDRLARTFAQQQQTRVQTDASDGNLSAQPHALRI
jgi:hypothetical protein